MIRQKFYLAVIPFLLLCASSLAQNQYLLPFQRASQSLLLKPYSGNLWQVTAGATLEIDTNRIWLTSYDENVIVDQSMALSFPSDFILEGAIATTLSSIVSYGYVYNEASKSYSVMVCNADFGKEPEWARRVNFPVGTPVVKGANLISGLGFVLYGLVEKDNSTDIFLLRFNLDGDLIWSKIIQKTQPAHLLIGGINDTEFATFYVFCGEKGTADSYIVGLSSDGELEFTSRINAPEILTSDFEPVGIHTQILQSIDLFYANTNIEESTFLAVCNWEPFQTSGTIFERSGVGVSNNGSGITIKQMSEDRQFGHFATGSILENGLERGFMLHLDPDLQVQQSSAFGDQFGTILNSATLLGETYAVGGLANPNGVIQNPEQEGRIAWQAHTDIFGLTSCHSDSLTISSSAAEFTTTIDNSLNIGNGPQAFTLDVFVDLLIPERSVLDCEAMTIADSEDLQIEIYPNPFQNYFTLKNAVKPTESSLQVIDICGKKVLFEINDNEIHINSGPGIYILQLEIDGKRASKRVVKM